jgi:hypothetical protein
MYSYLSRKRKHIDFEKEINAPHPEEVVYEG